MKRCFAALALTAIMLPSLILGQTSDAALIAKAKKIHEEVITLDTHVDINTANFTEKVNYKQTLPIQVDLPKMISGGLDVVWLIVYTGQGELNEEGYKKAYANAIDKFDAIHRLTKQIAPDKIGLALTSKEVKQLNKSGKKVAMIGVENAYPLGTDLGRIKEFADRGARYMSLAHNGHSQLSDSNTGERDNVWLHNGLSEMGKKAVAEMNKWGILVDLSHPSKQANLQMIKLSKAPVIASHSSARAICDHSRNLDDEELAAIKANGGVVQAVAFRGYVSKIKSDARAKLQSEILKEYADAAGLKILTTRAEVMRLPEAERNAYNAKLAEVRAKAKPILDARLDKEAPDVNVKDFVDHIDYMVKKMGIKHVGISSDFDGGGGIAGWDNASETLNVTIELVRRGYTKKQIELLWSANLLRVLDEAQKVAKRLQKMDR